MHGIGGRILHVDLNTGESREEKVPEGMVRDYLGGEGFAAKLFTELADPQVDPFDPDNPLVIAPGLFSGLPVPTCGKVVFMAKSPLTGTIAESVMGGSIGAQLKYAGYDALVLRGRCHSPSLLIIRDGEVELLDASDYWGMLTRDSSEAIRRDHGDLVVAAIGPAGERGVRYATVDCEDRQSGRAGLGAVMGSKNLKAVGVKGTNDLTVADPQGLIRLDLEWQDHIEESGEFHDDVNFGTGEFLDWMNEKRGAFPTKNWQKGVFEDRGRIDPHYWAPRYPIRNKACFACTKPCGKLFVVDQGPYAGTVVDGIEYETLYSLGSECENPDVEALARANELCDQWGIDTISTGVVIGFMMELVQRGIISVDEIGVDCRFGNSDAVPQMAEMIGRGEGMGELLGQGVMRIAQSIGKGSEYYALHIKGMEPPAYDARGLKPTGLGFMTSTRGACHLRAGNYALNLTGNFWKFRDVDRLSVEGAGYQVKEMEDFMAVFDALGACKFSRGIFLMEGFGPLLEAVVGFPLSETELLRIGERIHNLKQLFNYRAGFRREDFYLPRRVTEEAIPSGESEGAIITQEEMHRMLDDYLEARGWDAEGRPSREKLAELAL
ncbi:MAG: aldehyde ferredoxin oxidoreductase family protein [Methanomassiliicoccales archaeon]